MYIYSISVCLACYNGEQYIEEQVRSILSELREFDTLYIGDDNSQDSTLEILRKIKDPRISIIENKFNLGYVSNFELLVNLVKSDYIFFSDQDDVWTSGRVGLMIQASIESNKNVIFGRFKLIDYKSNLIKINNKKINIFSCNKNFLLNNIKSFFGAAMFPYFGSTLMITSNAKKYLFPIPDKKISHDIWISIVSNLRGDVFHLNDIVTKRRIHGANLTNSDRSLISKIATRLIWVKCIFLYVTK